MIASNSGKCECEVCKSNFQIYANSIWFDRSNEIKIGDVINCPNCNQQYIFIGDQTGENVFYRPNRFITKMI